MRPKGRFPLYVCNQVGRLDLPDKWRDEDENDDRRAVISPELRERIDAIKAGRKPGHSSVRPVVTTLTKRELEVLVLVADGLRNREIGERLLISYQTVKSHMDHIRLKLNARNRIEAVNGARACGLLADQ